MIGGLPPYYGRRVRFFEDVRFSSRAHHQGNEAPPPNRRDALLRELPRYSPCDWERMGQASIDSPEKQGEPVDISPFEALPEDEQADDSPALEEALEAEAAIDAEQVLERHDETAEQSQEAALTQNKRQAKELDEDRDLVIAKDQQRIQQLRRSQALQQNAELGRSVTKDLPL